MYVQMVRERDRDCVEKYVRQKKTKHKNKIKQVRSRINNWLTEWIESNECDRAGLAYRHMLRSLKLMRSQFISFATYFSVSYEYMSVYE